MEKHNRLRVAFWLSTTCESSSTGCFQLQGLEQRNKEHCYACVYIGHNLFASIASSKHDHHAPSSLQPTLRCYFDQSFEAVTVPKVLHLLGLCNFTPRSAHQPYG